MVSRYFLLYFLWKGEGDKASSNSSISFLYSIGGSSNAASYAFNEKFTFLNNVYILLISSFTASFLHS